MQQRQLQDLVREKQRCSVSSTAGLRDVALRFITSDSDVLAVTDSAGQFQGIVTESAVVRALLAHPASSMTIESLVIAHVDSVRVSSTLNSVLHLFRSSCHTAIPVVDDTNHLCGLLLRRDVMSTLLDELQQESSGRSVAAPLNEQTGATTIPSAHLNRDLTAPSARIDQPEKQLPAANSAPDDSRQPRPHFFSGDEARRRLGSITDFRGGFNENPW